jgi:hypothetical protein
MMMDPDMDLKRRHSIDNTVVLPIPPENTLHHRNLNNQMITLTSKMVDKGGLEKITPKNEVTQEKVYPPQRCS